MNVFRMLVAGCLAGWWTPIGAAQAQQVVPVAIVEVSAGVHGLQIHDGRAYIAAAGADHIDIVDLATYEVVGGFAAPDTPLDLIRSGDGWLVTAFTSDRIRYFPDGAAAPAAEWTVGRGPSLFTPDPVGSLVYVVSEFDDRLTVFDAAERRIVASYTTADRPYPADITANGALAFVPARDANAVTVVDLQNGQVVADVPVCRHPTGGALTIDETEYLVACSGDNQVWAVGTAEFEVTRKLRDVGPRPFAVEVSPGGTIAFANNADGTSVSVIDLASFTVRDWLPVGQQPIVMRVRGNRLYVMSEVADTFHIFEIREDGTAE